MENFVVTDLSNINKQRVETEFMRNNQFLCEVSEQQSKKEVISSFTIQSVKYDLKDKVVVVEYNAPIVYDNNLIKLKFVDLQQNIWDKLFWRNKNKKKYKISLIQLNCGFKPLYQIAFDECKLMNLIMPKYDYTHNTICNIKCVFKFKEIEFSNVLNLKEEYPKMFSFSETKRSQYKKAIAITKAQNEMLEDAKKSVLKNSKRDDKESICEIIDDAIQENILIAQKELSIDEKSIKKAKYNKRKNKKVIV